MSRLQSSAMSARPIVEADFSGNRALTAALIAARSVQRCNSIRVRILDMATLGTALQRQAALRFVGDRCGIRSDMQVLLHRAHAWNTLMPKLLGIRATRVDQSGGCGGCSHYQGRAAAEYHRFPRNTRAQGI